MLFESFIFVVIDGYYWSPIFCFIICLLLSCCIKYIVIAACKQNEVIIMIRSILWSILCDSLPRPLLFTSILRLVWCCGFIMLMESLCHLDSLVNKEPLLIPWNEFDGGTFNPNLKFPSIYIITRSALLHMYLVDT